MVKLVVLLIVAIDAKVLFDSLVHSFGLSVGLRVEGRRYPIFDAENARQGFPKMGSEDRAAVGNQGLWESMQTNDVVHEESSELCRVCGFRTRNEVDHFRKTVDKDKDSIEAFRCG